MILNLMSDSNKQAGPYYMDLQIIRYVDIFYICWSWPGFRNRQLTTGNRQLATSN
jgi:hypothetical protein